MNVLLTGSTGQIGRALIPKLLSQGHVVYALLRNPSHCPQGCIPLKGDVIQRDLGLEQIPHVQEVWNLAGVVNLRGGDKAFNVNSRGAYEVAHFSLRHEVGRLVHVSTAYASDHPRNLYEASKALGESYVSEVAQGFAGLHSPLPVTLFKPSIVVADSRALEPGGGAFYQFVRLMCSVHRRVELVRRKVEGTLRLPVIEPVFRMPGNPGGFLNLVPLDAVVGAIVGIRDQGCFWLTNPAPPTLAELGEWVGEVLLLKIRFEPQFDPGPIEALFMRLAEPFLCYLRGNDFKSDLQECPRVDKQFVQQSVVRSLL